MNIHKQNRYKLPHENKQSDIERYGLIAALLVAISMIIGGFL